MKEEPTQRPQLITMTVALILIIAAAVFESFLLAWAAFFTMSCAACMMMEYTDDLEEIRRTERAQIEEAVLMLEQHQQEGRTRV